MSAAKKRVVTGRVKVGIVTMEEEIMVVERPLVLNEGVRVRRTRQKQPNLERVVVRKQEAVITRL